MKLLVDTHLLLWAASQPAKLSDTARSLIVDPGNTLHFSAASFWEIAIKQSLGRDDFRVDMRKLQRGLIRNAYTELPVTTDHALALLRLPPIHKDPFDRVLVAQALTEGFTLVTADNVVASYGGGILLV